METKKWLSTKSREELQRTLGWGVPPVVSSKEVFSAHHPMIPKFYVPAWQLDMENRRNIIKNCELAGNPLWRGHVSYFLNGRAAECYTSSNVLQCRGLFQNTKEEVLTPLQVQQFYDDHD